MFQHGQGIEKNYKEAVKFYHMSAEQGYVHTQSNLTYMYSNGLGVPKDYLQAIHYYHLTADRGGYYIAQNNFAIMYKTGFHVQQRVWRDERLW